MIRGDDHVNNTPRQINIFRALGHEPPVFAHVPTVLGEDGQKLSKRHGAVGVMDYEAQGYLPEAMVNFLARLGWAHGDDEVFTRDEFVAWFDLDAISAAPSRFNAGKLKWLNQEHMKRLSEAELGRPPRAVSRARRARSRGGARAGCRRRAASGIGWRLSRRWPTRPATSTRRRRPCPDSSSAEAGDAKRVALEELATEFASLPWTRESLGAAMKAAAARHGLKPGEVMMAMRALVCGTRETPAIDAVLALLGRDTVVARLRHGLGSAG